MKKRKHNRWVPEECYEDIILLEFQRSLLENPFTWGTAQHFVYMLRVEIAEHNRLYHVLDNPVIEDYEYDERMNKLKEYVAKYPQTYHPECPSLVVGGACTRWPKLGDYRTDLLI